MKNFWKSTWLLCFLFNHSIYLKSLPQILSLYDNVDAIDVDKVVEYVKGLQQEDGSFAGDKWGEQGLLPQETFTFQIW